MICFFLNSYFAGEASQGLPEETQNSLMELVDLDHVVGIGGCIGTSVSKLTTWGSQCEWKDWHMRNKWLLGKELQGVYFSMLFRCRWRVLWMEFQILVKVSKAFRLSNFGFSIALLELSLKHCYFSWSEESFTAISMSLASKRSILEMDPCGDRH